MEFIGTVPGAAGRIPPPNLSLSPEMICKNYPFEFLMQPIIPLLSPPSSEKPSFCLSIPALKDACLGISKAFPKPTFQIIGVGLVATCISYGVWKVSLKLCSGIFAKESDADPDTEKLDDEVARILSAIQEECTVSTSCSCSNLNSHRDALQHMSTTSSVTDRFSQETLYSCAADVGKPLMQLQSRIDQVMNKVEVVISSLKVLEDNMTSPKRDGDRGDTEPMGAEGKVMGVAVLEKGKKERVFELSAPENQQTEMKIDTSAPYPKLPTNGLDSGIKHKSQVSSCMSGLGTGDKESNMVYIHQRIQDLEKRVDNMRNISQENKLSPCESMQSSFGSDRWDKSSSVSIISECNQEMINSTTSPRTLPITIQSLMTPSPHLDELTPPYDRRTRSHHLYKNMKRNIRSRPTNFTQFPTIEEDPFDPLYSDNANSDATHTILKEQNAAPVINTSPGGEITFPKQWNTVGDVKRQNTWPSFDNHYDSSQSHFCIPKINTFNSQFKQSENSCFEAMKPLTQNSERSYYQKTAASELSSMAPLKPQNSPRHGIFRREKFQMRSSDFSFESTSPDNPYPVPQKPHNSPRHGIFRKEKFLPKSSDFGFDSSSPATFSVSSTNTLPRNVVGSATTAQSKEIICEPYIEKSKSHLSNSQDYSFTATVAGDVHEWKASKHKLATSEADAPPRKLSRENVVASSPQSTEVNTKDDTKPVPLETSGGKCVPTPTHGSERFRRLSPFKKSSKRNNDFQVKYINKKGGEDGEKNSIGQSDKEDEWIVIVPNDKS